MKPFRSVKDTLGDLDAEIAGLLIAAAADIALILDGQGVVLDIALGAGDVVLEGVETWPGRAWSDLVTRDTKPKIAELISDAATQSATRWRQVNHPIGSDIVPVQYVTMTAGERIIAIGRDLRSMAMMQQRLLQAQQAMERDYERFRHAETRYRLLFQLASEAVLVVNARNRRVTEANDAARTLLANGHGDLTERPLAECLAPRHGDALEGLLDQVRARGGSDEISLQGEDDIRYFVSASLFAQDNSTYFLVRIRPSQERSDKLLISKPKSRVIDIVDRMPDGFVITDHRGEVIAANQSFVALTQLVSEAQVIGSSLDRWLNKPSMGLGVLMQSLRQQKTIRLFSTSLRGDYGEEAEVEISAVAIEDSDRLIYGFIVRDVGRRLAPMPSEDSDLRGAVQHMTELVGRVSLKDIVRETTDVIERLCIEAALELTSDNRASAAEMLGLSRQSLYVKMRRFNVDDEARD